MSTPIIRIDDPLYMLLREGEVEEFNRRKAAGETCNLTNGDFRSLELQGWDASGLDLSGAYFRLADLRGVDLSSCRLDGASIHDARIAGVLFPANLAPSEIQLSLLHGTRMRPAE